MKIRISLMLTVKKTLFSDTRAESTVLFEGNVSRLPKFMSEVGKHLNSLKLIMTDGRVPMDAAIAEAKHEVRDMIEDTIPNLATGFSPIKFSNSFFETEIVYLSGEALELKEKKATPEKLTVLVEKFISEKERRHATSAKRSTANNQFGRNRDHSRSSTR